LLLEIITITIPSNGVIYNLMSENFYKTLGFDNAKLQIIVGFIFFRMPYFKEYYSLMK